MARPLQAGRAQNLSCFVWTVIDQPNFFAPLKIRARVRATKYLCFSRVLFLFKAKIMPLSRRRRRKPVSARPVQQQTTPLHPPGQSLLEKLPVEIFNQIFCESQNVEFVLTSKSIYARLAYPSEWLVVEFFQCYGDGKTFSDQANI
jgi:hypothetical protein